MREIRPLSGLRFVAAFYVFIFHLNMPFRAPVTHIPGSIIELVKQGRLGVTVFFVLSGFVLVYSHLNDFQKRRAMPFRYWRTFIVNRLARIYPVFITGLAAFLLLSLALGSLPKLNIILLSATFFQTYFPSIAMLWYDGGAWSVANEIFFYLMFPWVLPLLLRASSKAVLLLVVGVSASFCTLMGLWSWLGPNYGLNSWQLSFSFPPARLPEFLAGMATALLVLRYEWKIKPWIAVGGGLFVLLYLARVAPHLGGTSVVHDWVVVPYLALLFSAIFFASEHPLFLWLGSDTMRYLGHISYAFYIAQIPLSALLDWLISSHRVSPDSHLIWPVALALNLGAATLLHHTIEKPAHRWIIAWSKHKYEMHSMAKRPNSLP